MKLANYDVPGLSQTSASVMNGEESRQFVRRRRGGLTIRLREVDRMVADIQAHIQILQQESSYLGLVRERLVAEKAKPKTV